MLVFCSPSQVALPSGSISRTYSHTHLAPASSLKHWTCPSSPGTFEATLSYLQTLLKTPHGPDRSERGSPYTAVVPDLTCRGPFYYREDLVSHILPCPDTYSPDRGGTPSQFPPSPPTLSLVDPREVGRPKDKPRTTATRPDILIYRHRSQRGHPAEGTSSQPHTHRFQRLNAIRYIHHNG